jgi:4-amino-4-deoxy-L-arabinose transferase-like glycosyltransferase
MVDRSIAVAGSSLAPALVGMLAARLSGVRAGWIAGLWLATFPVAVRYGSVRVPELLLETLLLAGVLLFLAAEARDSVVRGVIAGLVLGISYLTKEPEAFAAMAVVLYALVRRRWRLAFAVTAGAAFVVAAELAWYQVRAAISFFAFMPWVCTIAVPWRWRSMRTFPIASGDSTRT